MQQEEAESRPAVLQRYLSQLENRGFHSFTLLHGGHIKLTAKPPHGAAVPRQLIPTSVLQLFEAYQQGRLSKEELGLPAFYDRTKVLRRYGLLAPRATRSFAEKRAHSREYLKAWRQRNARSI